MSRIVMEVSFLTGTTIEEAILDTIEKCKEWNVAGIEFDFNGVTLFVNSQTLLHDVYSEYQLRQSRNK